MRYPCTPHLPLTRTFFTHIKTHSCNIRRMMRAGFLEMQLIPRSADRAPSRSFFTWRADVEAVFKRITCERDGPLCVVCEWGSALLSAQPQQQCMVRAEVQAAFQHFMQVRVYHPPIPPLNTQHAQQTQLTRTWLQCDERYSFVMGEHADTGAAHSPSPSPRPPTHTRHTQHTQLTPTWRRATLRAATHS